MTLTSTPTFNDSACVRDYLVEALRFDLIGPRPGDNVLGHEYLPHAPSRWYLTGFLAPTGAPGAQRAQDAEEELDEPSEPTQGSDDASTPERGSGKRAFLPSSMGLSVLTDASAKRLDIALSWGDYAPEEEPARNAANQGDEPGDDAAPARRRFAPWVRHPRAETIYIDLEAIQAGTPVRVDVPDSGGLEIVCLVRQTWVREVEGNLDARAVSLFVVNRRPAPEDDDLQDTAFAFQVEMSLTADRPFVPRHDPRGLESDDWDERLADLHYRDAAEYAVGHNVSTWAGTSDGACRRVHTEWMPRAAVERVKPSEIPDVEFGMEALGTLEDAADAKRSLNPLVRAYRDWIEDQHEKAQAFSGGRREVADELVSRATRAADRIQAGIDLLDDPDLLGAFRIANRAMAEAARRRRAQEECIPPEAVNPPEWRPFQLAYILMNLRGIAEPTHVEREIVDLLFFPTGGGKTEAYLGLAAFTLVLRRLRDPDPVHRGLSVLMRYTLRLLTLDQLGRAAALICALELEREAAPGELGTWPFEIALWVGRAATPNHMGQKGDRSNDTARAKTLRFARDTSRDPPLPLDRCPWCGTKFGKRSFRLDPDTDNPKNLSVCCANRRCDFAGKRHLPIVAVDEPIYERLPAFMIATADKFAAMPWSGETAGFFRGGDATDPRPPDLIIQDELHLISGPLGTMAGLYETAVNHLCQRQIDGKEVRPKIIASTATVRLAQKQIRALFGRSSVAVFPAPGIERRDSFFAEQAPQQEVHPRIYLGIAAQGRGPKVIFLRSTITLMAAAQAAWNAVTGGGVNPADPYMTVVAYFNALRELGSARRIVEDEIGSRLLTYAGRKRLDDAAGLFADRRIAFEPVELTSRVGTANVADAKRRLSLDFTDKERVDVALATNMISVGLDITRLGLMLVSGQPKTTAEYIQATSRVGRDPARPGLIVTLLNVHKPRDRSHYERFSAWHDSFYRGVEATSVTPFSPRALDRGLPAITVALARLGIPELTQMSAARGVKHHGTETAALAQAVADRAQNHADGLPDGFGGHVRNRVQSLIDDWVRLAHEAAQGGVAFGYARGTGTSTPLLREMIDPDRERLTDTQLRFRAPRSLRDVEPGVLLGIKTPEGRDIRRFQMADNILRQSQLITTYGPGAMIDLPEYSVIVSGLRDWSHLRREKIDEPRLVAKLRRLLGVPSLDLRTPQRHEENARQAAVGARIFPTWFIVKDARPSPRNAQWRRRRLVRRDYLDELQFRDEDGRRKPVVPVRFVCGCRRGHIDDLDWRRFVHQSGRTCERPLWLEERGTGADISDTFGVCDCGEERSLYEASSPGTGALGHCEGKRPWIGQFARETCGEPYRLLVRTASNAYFPQTMSVISLPEFDAGLAAKVSTHYDRLKAADDLGMLANFRMMPELDAAFHDVGDETVLAEYRRQKGGGEREDVPVKTAEFEILDKGDDFIGENDAHSKFYAQTLPRNDWDPNRHTLLATVDKLVLVYRLREVVSLLGFTRFEAISPDKDGELDLDVIRASLAETITWLPAVENQGEGIFLSFKTEKIKRWLARPGVQARGKVLLEGWQTWAVERHRPKDGFPGLPYVMLHSLSHLLMTSIALDCGYPASSLRERVYAGDGGYGILIYTGSSDSEGTLGGLVETGRRLAVYFQRALHSGRLCSNDPVCAEHAPDSQLEGRLLQGAACHGCLLIAETSCEQRNDFLDRALVVPTVGLGDASFFDLSEHGS